MRILLHYHRTDLFEGLVRERLPDAGIATCQSYDALPGAVRDFAPDVVYGIKFENRPYPRDAIVGQSSVKWMAVGGSGTDHIAPWDPDEFTVTNSAGVAAEVMAEYVLGVILALTLGLPRFFRLKENREWPLTSVGGTEGRVAAVVGLGHVGQAVARRLKANGLGVVGVRSRPRPTEAVDEVYGADALHRALGQADYVVVAVPLVAATKHWIDAAAFAAMKDGACLIDVSRGGVVDSAALIAALESGALAGAALDVFEREPMPDDCPLWGRDDVIITPHCSSVFDGWERKSVAMFCDNVERWMRGEPLENVVDPGRGY